MGQTTYNIIINNAISTNYHLPLRQLGQTVVMSSETNTHQLLWQLGQTTHLSLQQTTHLLLRPLGQTTHLVVTANVKKKNTRVVTASWKTTHMSLWQVGQTTHLSYWQLRNYTPVFTANGENDTSVVTAGGKITHLSLRQVDKVHTPVCRHGSCTLNVISID